MALAVFTIGFIHRTNTEGKNEAIAITNNTQQKMTAPATVVIHTGLFDKSQEEKRNFLLNNYEMDNLLGEKSAKISIIEYSSFTCKYCKKLRKEINKIIQEYVYDKKIANYATRPLYNTKTIPFGAFIQCSRKEDKQRIIDRLFEANVNSIVSMEDFLIKVGKDFNMNEEYVKSCLYNEEMYQKLIYMQQETNSVFDLKGTPVLIINGEEYAGYKTYQELKEIIDRIINNNNIKNNYVK
ncbi:MAG: thioredoxin domain-containing protein [Rickettsiales bacterium]|nr:thioredoxin domain-containing protein [Rickettsiales bacterium]